MTIDVRFTHTDGDGDKLEVRAGMLGAVLGVQSAEEAAEVAVRYEYLPGLIAALQSIVAESDLYAEASVPREESK
jgi:hypothetical protein